MKTSVSEWTKCQRRKKSLILLVAAFRFKINWLINHGPALCNPDEKEVTMRLICCSLLIVAAGPIFCFAQQRDISYDLWLTRSQTITAELIKDSTDLTQSERAELWARLAQKWWRYDPERAHSWLLRSIEIVEPVPNKEKVDERRERLNSTSLLFKIAAPLDKKLSERLLAILTQDAAQEVNEERTTHTERLIEVASFLAEKDPQRAAELGALALQLGNPTEIELLILKLRRKDVKLSNALFAQTLAAARKTLNRELLYSLTQVAFSDTLQPGANTIAVPDQLRIELLKLDLAYLQTDQINSQNRNSICISIGAFVAPVLAEFDRLLPQQAVIARQSLSQCQSINPLARQGVDGALRDQPLNTVDGLLKAASDAQDQKVRAVYEFRAALLARQQNDFDQALTILDNMSAPSREFTGGSWDSYRWEWAALSALSHLKNRDVWTKPLRGRHVRVLCKSPSIISTHRFTGFDSRKLPSTEHNVSRQTNILSLKGASHDYSPSTHDRRPAGTQSISAHHQDLYRLHR